MNQLASVNSLKKLSAVASLAVGALLASATTANAEVINHVWNANANGYWYTGTSWTPNAPDRIGAMGWPNLSRFDRVTVDGPYTVTNDQKTRFMTSNAGALTTSKTGTFNALTLLNGAKVVINKPMEGPSDNNVTFGVSTSSGGYVRNVLIGTGSTLSVIGTMSTGAQNATNDVSTWTIQGTVEANGFWGQQGSGNIGGNTQITGGYILNIDGGRMDIDGVFDWRSDKGMGTHGGEVVASLSTISTAQINLSKGGVLIADSMTANWIDSSNAFVNFVDGSGSLTFGKTNFANLSDVQSLIGSDHIRKGVAGTFQIDDNGNSWTVTVVPEASSVMLVMAGLAAGLMGVRSYRKGRRASC